MFVLSPPVILCFFLTLCFSDDLLMVHMVWRHGDRSPSGAFKSDPYDESSWYQHYGEITLKGMSRLKRLGKLIKKLYSDDLQFLSKDYVSNEIFLRSTDFNRTIISAMSNLIGMYYSNKTRAGVDYPDDADWPQHFVPISVHTAEGISDYILGPAIPCRRLFWLLSNVRKTPEYLKLKNESALLDNRITVIDKNYFVQMEAVQKMAGDMDFGLNISDYNEINLRLELAKLRGGGLLWDIISRMDQKIRCINVNNKENDECKWISALKYYAYSGHDTTVTALLTALGAKEKVIPLGGPFYGAALGIELWKLENGDAALKVKFYQEDDAIKEARNFTGTGGVFRDITFAIEGCQISNGYCLHDSFRRRSEAYYPGSQAVLCEDVVSRQTNMWTTQAPPTSTAMASNRIHRAFKPNFCFLFVLLCLWFRGFQV